MIVEDDGKYINDSIQLADTLNEVYKLSKFLKNGPKVILRYSYKDCEICMDTIVNQISILSKIMDVSKIIAITDSYSERDFLIKTHAKAYPIKVLNIKRESLGLYLEDKGFPILFVLGTDRKVSKILIPDKTNSHQINEYLNKVTRYVNTFEDN